VKRRARIRRIKEKAVDILSGRLGNNVWESVLRRDEF